MDVLRDCEDNLFNCFRDGYTFAYKRGQVHKPPHIAEVTLRFLYPYIPVKARRFITDKAGLRWAVDNMEGFVDRYIDFITE